MKRIIDSNHFFSMERVIFPTEAIIDSKCSIIRYTRSFRPNIINKRNLINDISYTLVSDLTYNEDEILNAFSATTRRHIRKANDLNIKYQIYSSKEILENMDLIKEFKKAFYSFCDSSNQPKLKKIYDEKLLLTYAKNDCIYFSKATAVNGTIYHIYITDGECAVIWYTISDYREEKVDAALLSYANKLTHYKDMIYFKSLGYKKYDWGNVSSKNNENQNGIDRFKTMFNGEYMETYSYTVGNSVLGEIMVFAKKILDKLQKR